LNEDSHFEVDERCKEINNWKRNFDNQINLSQMKILEIKNKILAVEFEKQGSGSKFDTEIAALDAEILHKLDLLQHF
jgi:hypothetical protein